MTNSDFEPQPKDLVYAKDPEDSEQDQPILVMVIRRATRQDKEAFIKKNIEDSKDILNIEEEIVKETLENFYSQDHFFLCIQDEEFTIVSREHMVSLGNRNNEDMLSEDSDGSSRTKG